MPSTPAPAALVALAALALAAPLAFAGTVPAAVPAVDPVPPGAGALDPWIDAAGDQMFGALDMGPNAIKLNGGLLESPIPGALHYNGQTVCLSGGGCGGGVARVDAGAGLTGGPITSTGTLSIASGGVTSAMIANGGVATIDLAFDPATQPELDALAAAGTINAAANPVQWTKLKGVPAGLADGTDADTTYTAGAGLALSGTTISVATGGVTNAMLAGNAVTAAKIADEPALKASPRSTTTIQLAPAATLRTLTVTFPAAGFAAFTSQASLSSFASQDVTVTLLEGSVELDRWAWDSGFSPDDIAPAQSWMSVVPVTAGSHTYSLRAEANGGGVSVTNAQLIVMYFPTQLA